MIDFENQIYTKVVTALRETFPNIHTESITIYSPEKFPCVCIEEADNYASQDTMDNGTSENHANVMYEVTVYSNKVSTAKSECKKIFSIIDSVFDELNFYRTVRTVVRTNDAHICRMVGRYNGTIDKNGIIYRRS